MDGPTQGAPADPAGPGPTAGPGATRRTASRVAVLASAGVLLALLGLMLATVVDYGMTADEPVQNRYGNRLVRWYVTLGEDRSAVEQHDTWLYGGFFELVAQAAEAVSPLDVYETRHVVNALFGFLGFVAVWWLGHELGGGATGLVSVLFLALTPQFYGHAFANPKDIPFASLFALAAAAGLAASRRLPRPGAAAVLGIGVAIGLTAGVRVAGIVLFGYTAVLWIGCVWLDRPGRCPSPPHPGPLRERSKSDVPGVVRSVAPSHQELQRARPGPGTSAAYEGRDDTRTVPDSASRLDQWTPVCLALGAVVVVGWAVMVAFWPYAQLDPIGNPLRAFRSFTHFWEGMRVLYDGELVRSGDVSRFSMPKLFALTLPETYLVAAVLGSSGLVAMLRTRPSPGEVLRRLFPGLCVATLATAPLVWAIALHTPLYNGNRHLLFIVPPLAALAATAVVVFLRGPWPRATKALGAAALAIAATVTASDMVRLHPYQSLYFNRLVAGGLARAATLYETDYWCITYKEGLEWIVAHYSRPDIAVRVRVAGHTILTQVSYNLRKTRERRERFRAVTVHDRPHLILATTATRDHERTPGRPVYVVERLGAPLLYVFEVVPPRTK